MEKKQFAFVYEVFKSINELNTEDALLLQEARNITAIAYAPYSHFNVGAAALLNNGSIVKGSNQENGSYPVGICAERALLAAVGTLFPNEPITAIAISYHNVNPNHSSNIPISPCGMCRQALVEYEERVHQSIRIILSGMEGEVISISQSNLLLPFGFKGNELKKK